MDVDLIKLVLLG